MKVKQNQTITTSKPAEPEAMVNAAWVAEVYKNGWGVAQDYGKAHRWYEKAAQHGNTDAMINLGRLYEQGLGVAQDHSKALEWFRKAIDAGNPYARIDFDRLYEKGPGDLARASRSFKSRQQKSEKRSKDGKEDLLKPRREAFVR